MDIYKKLKSFKSKHPMTVCWRLKKHAKIIEKHLNPGEKVMYVFAAQKNDNPLDMVTTAAVVLTNKRILVAQKRVLFGYFFLSITPDLFNDLQVRTGLIWGKVYIDTIKELVVLSNIAKSAVIDIETSVTEYMMEEKKKYGGTKKK